MGVISTYWHTLRYLRPVQFYGRVWFRLVKPRPELASAPAMRKADGYWVMPAKRSPSLLAPNVFRFLNVEHELKSPHLWNDQAIEKLWLYNLHYFDDLNAEDAQSRLVWHLALLRRWVYENPPAEGTGWEPYPTSLRIVNWIKWSLAGNPLPPECLQSLAVQTRWLSRRLEFHLLGNHLFSNAKALVFAGMFFCGKESEGWLEKGIRILEREIPEQILVDGGQFERSTMYHALALEDMLDLYNVSIAFQKVVPAQWASWINNWPEIIGRMRFWLATMCHPDGDISFFNDAAMGISPSPAKLETYALRLGFSPLDEIPDGMTHLAESGYIRIKCEEIFAFLDVAPIGPDYLPGHAHADTLSFELSLFGNRVFVNSGTSLYGKSVERILQRGTGAHTALMLNSVNSSEVWGDFRVARRARVLSTKIWQEDEMMCVMAAHDGYRHHSGQPIHWRCWRIGKGCLWIEDRLEGAGENQIEIFFHLHPDMCPKPVENSCIAIREQSGDRLFHFSVEHADSGNLHLEKKCWHPEFGVSVPSTSIVFRATQMLPAKFIFKIRC